MCFKIGNVQIKNNVVLAPIAGISNPSYIKICEEMGVGLAFTELISAEAIVRNNKKTLEMLNGIEEINIPVAVQIFGSNKDTMAKASKILTDIYDIKIIDINMGCPVPKVALRSEAGSGLLKNPKKIEQIVKEVVKNVDVPVTVKIRSGWDSDSINAVEVAKIIESAGASAITIHPRTRAQNYSGKADWNIIKQVKEVVNIPVIGNGDIKTIYDAKKMLDETSCDAIMIGRALLGNPWLIKEVLEYLENGKVMKSPTIEDKINMAIKHFELLLKNNPEKKAVLEMRGNISYYLKGLPNSIEIKKEIYQIKTKNEFLKILKEYLNKN